MKSQSSRVYTTFEFFLFDEIQMIGEYAGAVESSIKKEFEKKALKLVENIDKVSEEERELLEVHHEQIVWKFRGMFPRILRNSVFLACYSFLESKLNELCRNIGSHTHIKLNDLAGSGVIRANNYLSKVIQIPKVNALLWKRIIVYNKIRNKIAHSEGRLSNDGDSKAIRAFCKKRDSFKINYSRIELLETFVPDVLHDIKMLFSELKAALGDRFP